MTAVAMIDDLELVAVQWIRQESEHGFARHDIPGLEGTLHQSLGRRSHRVRLSGMLLTDTATDDLAALQGKATAGDEVTFTADIATALAVDHMLIEELSTEQEVGRSGQFRYAMTLVESPPLPEPAQATPFGGLDDLGLGDLGFDAGALDGVLGDITDQAGLLTGALDAALDAVGAIAALPDLGDVGGLLEPLTSELGGLSELGSAVSAMIDTLGDVLQ